MNPSDQWLAEHLPGTCPELAVEWIKESGLILNDPNYQHFKTVINRRMRIGEKYGLFQWTGEVQKDGSKIWNNA